MCQNGLIIFVARSLSRRKTNINIQYVMHFIRVRQGPVNRRYTGDSVSVKLTLQFISETHLQLNLHFIGKSIQNASKIYCISFIIEKQ